MMLVNMYKEDVKAVETKDKKCKKKREYQSGSGNGKQLSLLLSML